MNFLDYSNKTNSNIIPKEGFQELVQEVFGVISENIANSLGPLGGPATILDGQCTVATKDGFSIFKNYAFRNRYKNMVYNLIKAPCTKLNNTVGDGTTTAIVLTDFMYKAYNDNKHELEMLYRLPRTFTKAWDEVIEDLIQGLKKYSRPIDRSVDSEDIYNLAYISSNGNDEISKNISNIYKESKFPVIKLKKSPTNKSFTKSIIGYEFPANLLDPIYVKNDDLGTEEENIKVLLFDHKVNRDTFEQIIIPMDSVCRQLGTKLLVVAPTYDEHLVMSALKPYIRNQCVTTNNNPTLIITQYKYANISEFQLEDLATVLGTESINSMITQDVFDAIKDLSDGEINDFFRKMASGGDYQFNFVGTSKNVMLSLKDGAIFKEGDLSDNHAYQVKLAEARKAVDDILSKTDNDVQAYSIKIADANSRVAQLEMENYIYYVGANSSLEHNQLWDSVEDVVKCVRSAVKHGVVPGCQISIIRACEDITTNYAMIKHSPTLYDLTAYGGDILSSIYFTELKVRITDLISKSVKNLYMKVLNGPDNNGIRRMAEYVNHQHEVGLINRDTNNRWIVDKDIQCYDEYVFNTYILNKSIYKRAAFDADTVSLNEKIITSVETDINVLIAASDLVKLLISGNQCVYVDPVINGSEDSELPM